MRRVCAHFLSSRQYFVREMVRRIACNIVVPLFIHSVLDAILPWDSRCAQLILAPVRSDQVAQ